MDLVIASVHTLVNYEKSPRLQQYEEWAGIVIVDEADHMRVGGIYDRVLTPLKLGGRYNDSKNKGHKVRVGIAAHIIVPSLSCPARASFARAIAVLGDSFL
jgi:hypothetical protein